MAYLRCEKSQRTSARIVHNTSEMWTWYPHNTSLEHYW